MRCSARACEVCVWGGGRRGDLCVCQARCLGTRYCPMHHAVDFRLVGKALEPLCHCPLLSRCIARQQGATVRG